MGKRIWKIELDSNIYTIRLEHGVWLGRRIWVNEHLVEKGRKFFDTGSVHTLDIDGHACELGIVTNGITFDYYLQIDGAFIEPIQGALTKGFLTRRIQTSQEETQYWQDLTECTGLHYVEIPDASGGWRHRLIGKVNGYWVVIKPVWMLNTNQVMISVLVRFARSPEREAIRAQIESDPAIRKLIGKWTNRKRLLKVQDGYTWIALRYSPRRETASQIAAKITAIVDIVANYAHPLPDMLCEGENFELGTIHGSHKLVLVNGVLLFLCSNCLQGIKDHEERARLAYEAAPSGLLRGLLAGLAATLPISLLWAAIVVLFDQIGAIFAALILVVLVRVMDWVRAKRTVWSILLAAGLAMISVVLGTYFALLWYVWQELGRLSSVDVLSNVWRFMFQDSKMLTSSLFISLLGIVPYLWIIWKKQRDDLERSFNPKVEILEGFHEV